MSDCFNLDQLLEPDPDQGFAVVNNNQSPSFFERNSTSLTPGVTTLTITFQQTKINADYTFNELEVRNTTDASPLDINVTVTSKTRGGFTVELNADPDTGNYLLDWEVQVEII